MADDVGTSGDATGALALPLRVPAKRLGVAVVEALVDLIVSGRLAPGESLPPELPLSEQFGVSRTVLRESVKRLEEKGLVTVSQGRGTVVQPTRSWNMLDRVVLQALIAHDKTLGVLDELTVVRGQLESAMASETAASLTPAQLAPLREALEEMRTSIDDVPRFLAADVAFHETVMAMSGNRLAESIARILYERARESARYARVDVPASFHEQTLREHERVFEAIAAGSPEEAATAMYRHVVDAWTRRRPTDHRGSKSAGR
ncbi:FadR/GntR family transcriptional regulator [Isoptericola sp. BMS4]|uniref:FadR/GntR family transcriptional regulator n=1 Tax=Isoptericola sp. BMS4 TaxID=2527875 RepID=UPI0014247B97|nr:FadR/GntR family transcriptional regulator [Isoptericola sp. BMS4]